MDKVTLADKFACFSEYWTPKIIGEANGQYVKVAKALGETVWHQHDREDEVFVVVQGVLTIHFSDRVVALGAGELYIVARGVEHKTSASEETHFMIIEPTSTAHTGSVASNLTVPIEQQVWI